MSEEERVKYNINLDTYRTNLSVMKNERAEGRKEGLAKGEKNGEMKTNIATATKMKEDGFPINTIQKYTGLTAEEIERL